MSQSLHDFVITKLQEAKGSWPSIAEATGVSNRTIQKIASREINDPGVSHIEKLAKYFRDTIKAA
jgi:transcriptional regulator with XRE-family HTH domain